MLTARRAEDGPGGRWRVGARLVPWVGARSIAARRAADPGPARRAGMGPHIRWELEGQALKHFGGQERVEFVGSINARWITFPWNRYRATSIAAGGGLSVTSEVPVLEKRDPDNSDAATLLHYLLLEAAVGLPDSPWSLVARVHHRSGVFGVFSHSGSNVLELGIRYRF